MTTRQLPQPHGRPSDNRLGFLGLIGAICFLVSGPGAAVALIFLFVRGEQRGSNALAVSLCRLVGLVAVAIGIVAALGLIGAMIAHA